MALSQLMNVAAAEADLRYAEGMNATRMYLSERKSIDEAIVQRDMPMPYNAAG